MRVAATTLPFARGACSDLCLVVDGDLGSTSMKLADVFTTHAIISLAGSRIYERGVRYLADGRVERVAGSSSSLKAKVRGTFPYTVELWANKGNPGWSCTCPFAEDGAFCKHCVAVGLMVARGPESIGGAIPEPDDVSIGADVAEYVEDLSRERLIEIVSEQSERDWRLRDRMVAEAQVARGDGADTGMWQRRIDSAFTSFHDFIEYREAEEWASGVFDVLDGLADLLEAGQADAVVTLAEYVHRSADAAIGYVDDSAGWLIGIEEQVSQLHHDACEQARPDPIALARRLADLELTSELDGFHRAAVTYSELLGDTGIAEYRRLVEDERQPVRDDASRRESGRFAVEQARIGVAIASGDPDELIAVRDDDLRSPYDYLEIARMLVWADRIDEAVGWSQRGLAEFADRTHQLPELRDFLAALFRKQGRDTDAVGLYWSGFLAAPSLSSYRSLLAEAGDDAEDWAARCIEALQGHLAEGGDDEQGGRAHLIGHPAAALIEILMYEGEVETAWMVATEHGCSDATWMTLARAREATHPLASISVYERTVFDEIGKKKRNAYLMAIDLLDRIRRLADSAGQPDRFTDVIERVRSEHRPKRSLMAMLDDKGW